MAKAQAIRLGDIVRFNPDYLPTSSDASWLGKVVRSQGMWAVETISSDVFQVDGVYSLVNWFDHTGSRLTGINLDKLRLYESVGSFKRVWRHHDG